MRNYIAYCSFIVDKIYVPSNIPKERNLKLGDTLPTAQVVYFSRLYLARKSILRLPINCLVILGVLRMAREPDFFQP